jgi:hypothetical protein
MVGVSFLKKKYVLVFICVLVLFIAFFSYKGYLLFNYKVEVNDKLKEQLKDSNDTITVTTSSYVDSGDMVEFENLIYKKIDDNFVLDEEKSSNNPQTPYNSYYLNDLNSNENIALFVVGKTYNVYEILTASNSDINTFGFSFKDTNKKELLQKYNLKDDFDIYKYFINHYDEKVNVFSAESKIKLNYLIKTYVNVVVPVSKINLIDGGLKGYMYTINNGFMYEVHIIHNGTNYAFGFYNRKDSKYFDLSDIKEFLSTVYFKDTK